jgi:hypothetical protein
MNSSPTSGVKSSKPALELISLARMSPETARQSLRKMLIANPDYFSKITGDAFKAVLRIQQDTTYESIGYVAYSQSFEQLQATINITQSIGYSDENYASKEYIRFHISFDGGLSWLDQGVNSVDVHDQHRPKPRQHFVSIGISPAPRVCIKDRVLVVRAILSWNDPPPADSPDWIPVWGDVLNAVIDLEYLDGLPLYRRHDDISNQEPDMRLC